MRNIHIEDSYNIWDTYDMTYIISAKCFEKFGSHNPQAILNRTYASMYVEWWAHNIGYYITKPFCFVEPIKKINLRCKDVDLEEYP